METKDLKEEFRRGAKYILRSDAEVCRSSQDGYSYVRALRDRYIKRSGPDLGARAAKRRDRPRGGPAAGPDERVSPSLHLARATMKHTSAAQQRSTVWFSLKSSQLQYVASRF